MQINKIRGQKYVIMINFSGIQNIVKIYYENLYSEKTDKPEKRNYLKHVIHKWNRRSRVKL